MRGRYTALSILALAAGTFGGIYLERLYLNPTDGAGSDGPEILYWVAPMDPNFRQPEPGKSPMGMDLVPVYAGQEPSGDPTEVNLSAAEINAIGVRTTLAQLTEISPQIETVGFVSYDEHRTAHVHIRVEGWIERLNVRAIGDQVREGEPLFDMFAPEIGAATGEFVRAVASGNQRIIDVSRNNLRSQGMSEVQIAEIEAGGELVRNIRVVAPQDGVVIALDAADGMFLQPGTKALSLTDLSSVWLIVDVFERDIGRLEDTMQVEARFEHLPGRVFTGKIDYIYPELDAKTRTLPVRLRFDNSEGLLRPNMFGTVRLMPQLLRTAVTVPSEAVIRTGGGERVILSTGEGTFKPRLVTTGLRDSFSEGGRTEILQGLAPGEEVVASAQFLIDSESALSSGMTRMAPTDEAPARGTGTLVALDPVKRVAEIAHEAFESLDWPAMTTQFAIRADVPLTRLEEGMEVAFRATRGADGTLGLIELAADDGIAASGTGIAQAVTPDGKLTLSHDPIPDLGWPAMVMDLDLHGVDPDTIPLETPIAFDLSKDDGGMFAIIAVRPEGEMTMEPKGSVAKEEPAQAITVTGSIKAVNSNKRLATITHGPIAEIGMPGMTMDFAVADTLGLGTLPIDQDGTLTFERPDGMTMVLAAFDLAAPALRVDGTINSIDANTRMANITHGPMAQIGMPGMTMNFLVDEGVDLTVLEPGKDQILELRQNPDFSMTLVGVLPPPITSTGRINRIDAQARTANVTHGPIAAIGMPGMTMDFVLDETLDDESLPLETELTLLLRQNPDFSMTLVGVEAMEVTQ